jgi:hypothetical protein
MKGLVTVLRELAGLFVDDGALALAIIAVCIAASIAAALVPGSIGAGALLVFGCLGVLLANVLRAARR